MDFGIPISGRSKIYQPLREVTPLSVIRIRYDYPLYAVVYKTYYSRNGFTRQRILNLIRKAYSSFYRHPAQFGVWGHGIKDLWLVDVMHANANNFYLEISS